MQLIVSKILQFQINLILAHPAYTLPSVNVGTTASSSRRRVAAVAGFPSDREKCGRCLGAWWRPVSAAVNAARVGDEQTGWRWLPPETLWEELHQNSVQCRDQRRSAALQVGRISWLAFELKCFALRVSRAKIGSLSFFVNPRDSMLAFTG